MNQQNPQGETTSTGATRSVIRRKRPRNPHDVRLDLILLNRVAMERLGATLGEGEAKYGAFNWMNGFEESVLLDHALEHLSLYLTGDRSEDHLAHAVWNLNTLMWVQEKKPELLDLTLAREEFNDIAPAT